MIQKCPERIENRRDCTKKEHKQKIKQIEKDNGERKDPVAKWLRESERDRERHTNKGENGEQRKRKYTQWGRRGEGRK